MKPTQYTVQNTVDNQDGTETVTYTVTGEDQYVITVPTNSDLDTIIKG